MSHISYWMSDLVTYFYIIIYFAILDLVIADTGNNNRANSKPTS